MFLKVCVWDAELRELRAECFIKEGEPRKAISDLKAASKLKNDNTEAFYKISILYYQLGDHELSLRSVPSLPSWSFQSSCYVNRHIKAFKDAYSHSNNLGSP